MTDHERRMALVELMIAAYDLKLPTGMPLKEIRRERWAPGFVEVLAKTPPVLDLDRQIDVGLRALERQTVAMWQGATS